MIYFSFIGNHDRINPDSKEYGAVINIFKEYHNKIKKVFFFITPSNSNIDYLSIAKRNIEVLNLINPNIQVIPIQIDIINPIDYDIVYPVMLDKITTIIKDYKIDDNKKIINITSGTPTMTACWVLLSQSGILKKSKLIQSFQSKFARNGKTVKEVNFNIDDFPSIKLSSSLKLKLTLLSRKNEELVEVLELEKLKKEFPEIIGESKNILEIKDQLLHEVNNNTNVLIIGERGTGKEVIAKAIWNKYHLDNNNELITFDCGTFSKDLIESELFGHVKGAFTGADKEKKGIFERYSDRIIFLDEIGNLSKEGQAKLLRVIANGEYHKIGESKIRKTNVCIIAATNKNINDENIFAQDLKDRFDEIIELEPLRNRKNDIPLLVEYFLSQFNSTNKPISPVTFDDKIVEKLNEYNWPDNVRGLEQWIKRLLRRLAKGGVIKYKDVPKKYFRNFKIEDKYSVELPSLPLPIPLDEFTNLIKNKARALSNGKYALVDFLLHQKPGTEKQRQYRKRKKKLI